MQQQNVDDDLTDDVLTGTLEGQMNLILSVTVYHRSRKDRCFHQSKVHYNDHLISVFYADVDVDAAAAVDDDDDAADGQEQRQQKSVQCDHFYSQDNLLYRGHLYPVHRHC